MTVAIATRLASHLSAACSKNSAQTSCRPSAQLVVGSDYWAVPWYP
jgi:hypothetical protein